MKMMKGTTTKVTKTKSDDGDDNSAQSDEAVKMVPEAQLVPDVHGLFERYKYKNVRVHHVFGNSFRVNVYDKIPGGRITKSFFVTYTFDGLVASDPPLTMATVK
jgi:hypothetical protein